MHPGNPPRRPLLCLAILTGMYLLDPAGGHGAPWLFGTRLLLEVLVLLILGVLCAQPGRTLTHLLRAFTVMLVVEAVFAWIQQLAGPTALVFQWGYRYGAQVRVTSGGGLRTSGTFEDPFQLVALAVLGLALALFVAPRRQAVILTVAAIAVLGATSVRTAMLQAALLLVIFLIRRGWWRQTAALAAVACFRRRVCPRHHNDRCPARSAAGIPAADPERTIDRMGAGRGQLGFPGRRPWGRGSRDWLDPGGNGSIGSACVRPDIGSSGRVCGKFSLPRLVLRTSAVRRWDSGNPRPGRQSGRPLSDPPGACRRRSDDNAAWAALAVLAVFGGRLDR